MDNSQGDWKAFILSASDAILKETASLRQECIADIFATIRSESSRIERHITEVLESRLQNEMKRMNDKIHDYVITRMAGIQKSGQATKLSVSEEIVAGLTDVLQRSVEASRNEERKVAEERIRNLESEYEDHVRKIKQDAIDEMKDTEVKMQDYTQKAIDAAKQEKAKIRETMKDKELEFTQMKHRMEAAITSLESKIAQMHQRLEELVRDNEQAEDRRDFLRRDLSSFFDLAYKASDHSVISSKPSIAEDEEQ